jgi:dephospho-CoA kinase
LAVRRVVEFRGMSEDDAWNRINSQMTREKRLAAATHVIDNSGSLDDLIDQVDRIWPELLRLAPTVPEAIRADARSDRADDDG